MQVLGCLPQAGLYFAVLAWLAGRAGVAGDFGGDDFGDPLGVGWQGGVLVAEGDADLAGDSVGGGSEWWRSRWSL